MTYEIEYAYTSHMGKIRENNEDNFWCQGTYLPAENTGTGDVRTAKVTADEGAVLAVFDGMGGESCGEMAAFLAAQELGACWEAEGRRSRRNTGKSGDTGQSSGAVQSGSVGSPAKSTGTDPVSGFWNAACRRMNEAICRYCRENRIHSMGTTLAAVRFLPEEIQVCNLGDSRIYQFCKGELKQLSEDHVARGGLFGKAPLTQYLGIQEEDMALEPVFRNLPYEEEAGILLCSDGMTDMISDTEIREILACGFSVEETVQRFLERALEKGGRDNITIVLCRVKAGTQKSFWNTMGTKIRKYLGDKR